MRHPRSGAALIMAIVILAALLMLGLPFLFSQSASLSGTRSFAHSQQAQTGRSTAEDLGVGAATYLTRMLYTQGSANESTDLNRVGMGLTPTTDPRRRTLDLSPVGHGFNPAEPRNTALIGLSLEDEAGKLDPNHLDVEAWDRLLTQVGIGDWDDDNGNGKDTDGYGQLAYALAAVRFDQNICPTGRITRLEQLLEAKPLPEGVRHPLTRAELAQLKPYLTLSSLGQGREGLVDLGTIVQVRAGDEVLDSLAPADVIAYPTTPGLFAAGSVIVSKHPTRPLPQAQQQRGRRYNYGMSTSTDLDTIPTGTNRPNLQNSPRPSGWYPDSHRPRHEEAVAVEIPAPVNLTESSKAVREVLWSINRQAPNDLHALMQVRAALPDVFGRQITGYHLVNPLGVFDDMDVNSSAYVEQSRIGDPGSGITNMNPPNGNLTASATVIHIRGGALDRMPGSGFARIESVDPGSGSTSQIEYISYRGGLPSNGGRATIYNVTRGLNFPGSTGPLDHPENSRITIIAPRELPPLAVASQGVVTIESGASVADAAGRQGAQQMRRVVAQAVPQEQLLEVRWEKPTQYHALLVQRHGSLMNAFPSGYQRLRDELPENRTGPRGPDKDDQIGVKPGTLRTHLVSTHLGSNWRNGREWFVRFGVEGASPNNADFIDYHFYGQQARPTVGGYNFHSLSPEGLKLSGGPLAYPMVVAPLPNDANTMGGFLTHPITTRTAAPLNGRQFGMWVKPTQTLSGTVTLFDLRSPAANAGERYAQSATLQPDGMQQREPGDNYYQNRLTLTYEDATKQLVLTICNGAIEHLADHGQICPGELYTFPGSGAPVPPAVPGPYVDPRCLGTVAAPGTSPGLHPLAPRRPLNLVQHRYQLSPTDGLKADQWHLIQVALVGNDPGHMAITVNGIVGREVTRMTSALQMREVGDHLTLPSLVLRTALPAATGSASNPSQIIRPAIEVDALAVDPMTGQVVTGAAAVAAILPARGMIRIGNEYISYENLQGTTLMNCLRGRRQDTHVGSADANYNWLVLEEHRTGDLVVPGGIRYNPGTDGHLWKGGCTLAQPLPNGDPMRNYTVWAELSTPSTIDMTTGLPVLQMTATTIGVQNGVLMQWPPRGYAQLSSGEIIYYDNGAPPTMTLNNVDRGQLGTTAVDLLFPAAPTPTNIPTITLLSFEGVGDPNGNYPNTPPPVVGQPRPVPSERQLVQVGDPLTGRIEWINYDHIDTSRGMPFFIDFQRYRYDPARRDWGSRARERTAFAATDIPGGQMMTFPQGSHLIPVQTTLTTSHVLVTGDVVTITPKDPTMRRPWQACIRYAATDGFDPAGGLPPADNTWDTVNRYFAFSEPLPDNWPDGSFELIGWPGWSGNDIGPGGPAISSRDNELLPYFTMPLAGAFGMNAQVYFGGDNTTLPFVNQPGHQPFTGVIDALWSGMQPGGQPRNSNRPFPPDNLVIRLGTSGPDLTSAQQWLAAGTLPNNVTIQTTNPVFEHELGLVLIGGEVFAYERQRQGNDWDATRSTIRLIGRGLLGSTPVIHRGPEPALVLPIGPVGRLARAVSSGTNDQELFLSTRAVRDNSLEDPSNSNKAVLNAPAMLLCSSDGTKMEVITAPNRGIAPWHRGMYNTLVQGSWPGSTTSTSPQQDTLVIGWWPRYPSGMPNQQSQTWNALSTTHRSALMRCRMYGWMGFPIRFHDTWLTGGNGLADIEVIDDGVGTFNVLASALEEGFDWEESLATGMSLRSGGGGQDASAVFSRLANRAVDGVELRLRWEYQLPPADPAQGGGASGNAAAAFLDRVARAGNTAPMIGKVRLRARAPAKVLQVEDAR